MPEPGVLGTPDWALFCFTPSEDSDVARRPVDLAHDAVEGGTQLGLVEGVLGLATAAWSAATVAWAASTSAWVYGCRPA